MLLIGLTTIGRGATEYLQLPSAGGGTTSWSGSSGTVGTNAGNTVATANGGGVAATFSSAGQTYSLTTNAFFDVSALGAGTYTIGDTASTIDLNGHALTVKAVTGQAVTFGAKLSNSLTVGGLTVLGGGAVLFDNTVSQYASGMDLDALAIDGSTVTLPAGAAFGPRNDAGASYSSINLTNSATLILSNGTVIGLPDFSSSVALSLGSGSIKLADGGATATLIPHFVGTSTASILNFDTNGGTLNVYGNYVNGNGVGGYPGDNVTLNVSDTAGTPGTLNLYGWQNLSRGGNDYSGSNVTIASGALQLKFDTDSQSLGTIDLTGGVITGSAYALDITMAGASQLNATNFQVNSLSMSGTAKLSGVVNLAGDLNLTDSAVFAPAASASPTYLGSNLNANSGTPHYVVTYDGTNLSELSVSGPPDTANLEVDLHLAAGTYSTGTQNLTILTAGYLGTAPTVAPKWNIDGVFRDAGHTQPASGDEIELSLSPSGNDFNLVLTINHSLYVVSSTTPNYITPFTPIPPAVSSINRTGATPTNAASVGFTVTFSEAVTGVDTSDFTLSTTGTAAGTIASATGSGAVYTVVVNTVSGDGTLRLDLKSSGTGITNAETTAISGGYTSGQSYTIDTTAPSASSAFAAIATGSTIALTWTNPIDSDFSTCAIRRSTSAFPTTISSGTAVASGLTGTSHNQTSLADGTYYYAIFSLDAVGNVSMAGTASATVDTVTATPVLTAPGNGSTDNALFVLNYTLPEAGTGGSVELTFTRTGGVADAGSPHVLTLIGGMAAVGPHAFSLNAANFTADSNVAAHTGGAALVDGAIYTVTLSYQDVLGNVAATVTNTGVTYDNTTAVPTLTTPATNAADNATFAAAFNLPETAMAGSVSLTFTRSGGTADAGSPHVLTLAGSMAGAGTHTATLNAANFFADASVAALSGGAALADGAIYTVTISYQDAIGNPTATAASTGVTYDISVATPAAPTLNAASDSGFSSADGITNDPTPRIEGTAEANGMLEIFIDSNLALGLALDGTGNWWFDASTALNDGSHTFTTRVTDRAGNVSAVSSPLTVTIDTTSPVAPAGFTAVAAGGTIALSWTNPVSDFASCTLRRSLVAYPTSVTDGTAVATGSTGTSYSDTALADGSYYYAIFALDAAGNISISATASATVIPANLAPTNITLSASSVNRSAGVNATVGTLSSTDTDSVSFAYSLVSGTGSTDNGSFAISGTTLHANDASLLAAGSYSIRIRTTDDLGATFEKSFSITVVDDPSAWEISAAEDFNGDGKPDLFWTNTTTGDRAVWLMNGRTVVTNSFVSTVPLHWSVSAAGDFNGDGKADIFWTDTTTGDRAVWLMNGGTVSDGGFVGWIPLEWQANRAGDFDGDGKDDILWTNTTTGERSIWLMNGTSSRSDSSTLGTVPVAWEVSGTGDYNGDGKDDILWTNSTTGDRAVWLMNGTTITANSFVSTVPTTWAVGGSGDFNGDGKADIFWTNTATGDRAVWLMDGSTMSAGGYLGAVPVTWGIVNATKDINGDGKADLLWSNSVTSAQSVWFLDGATAIGGE